MKNKVPYALDNPEYMIDRMKATGKSEKIKVAKLLIEILKEAVERMENHGQRR